TRARTPAARRPVSRMVSRFKLRSRAPIRAPIQVTGWPIARTSRSEYPTMASISRARHASVTAMTPDPEHDPEKWLPVFGKRSCSTNAALITHGGDLGDARRLFPSAPEPFIDLSTGINPHSYPLPQLLPEVFARLPDAAALARLTAAAARAY